MRRGRKGSTDNFDAEELPDVTQLAEVTARVTARVATRPPSLLPLQMRRTLAETALRLDPQQRRLWLGYSVWSKRPEVVRTLLAESLAAVREDAARSEQLARVALEVVHALKKDTLSVLVADLTAEASGLLANALRVQERYDEAELLWREVRRLLPRGSGDGLLRARLEHHLCAYHRDRRQLIAAAQAGRRSVQMLAALGHTDEAALASFRLSSVYYSAGQMEEALAVLARLQLGDLASEIAHSHRPGFVYNLILYLIELGELTMASALLTLSEPLYRTEGTPNLLLQLAWVRGKLLAGRRKFREGAEAFRALRQDYLDRERPFDAALVGLDEMLCLAETGRLVAACELAREILPVFARLELPGETAQAIETLERAASRVRADLKLVRQVHALLQPLRKLPPVA